MIKEIVFLKVFCNYCRRGHNFYVTEDDKRVRCISCDKDSEEAVKDYFRMLPDDTDFSMVEIY